MYSEELIVIDVNTDSPRTCSNTSTESGMIMLSSSTSSTDPCASRSVSESFTTERGNFLIDEIVIDGDDPEPSTSGNSSNVGNVAQPQISTRMSRLMEQMARLRLEQIIPQKKYNELNRAKFELKAAIKQNDQDLKELSRIKREPATVNRQLIASMKELSSYVVKNNLQITAQRSTILAQTKMINVLSNPLQSVPAQSVAGPRNNAPMLYVDRSSANIPELPGSNISGPVTSHASMSFTSIGRQSTGINIPVMGINIPVKAGSHNRNSFKKLSFFDGSGRKFLYAASPLPYVDKPQNGVKAVSQNRELPTAAVHSLTGVRKEDDIECIEDVECIALQPNEIQKLDSARIVIKVNMDLKTGHVKKPLQYPPGLQKIADRDHIVKLNIKTTTNEFELINRINGEVVYPYELDPSISTVRLYYYVESKDHTWVHSSTIKCRPTRITKFSIEFCKNEPFLAGDKIVLFAYISSPANKYVSDRVSFCLAFEKVTKGFPSSESQHVFNHNNLRQPSYVASNQMGDSHYQVFIPNQ